MKDSEISITLFKNKVELSKVCSVTGSPYLLMLDKKRFEKYKKGGQLIQDIFPELSDEEREFLLTGTTPEEGKIVSEEGKIR